MKAPSSVGASELNALRERLETHRVALQQLRSRTDRAELLGDGAKKRPLDAKERCEFPWDFFMGFPWDFYGFSWFHGISIGFLYGISLWDLITKHDFYVLMNGNGFFHS